MSLPRPAARRLLSLLAIPFVLAACATPSSDTAADVGGATISMDQLTNDIALFTFLTGLSGGTCGTPAAGESAEAACARFALDNDIREEVARAYAQEHDVRIDEADVEAAMTSLEEGFGGPEGVEAQFAEAGVSRAQVEEMARRLLLVNAVQTAVVAERLDEDALLEAYEDRLPALTTLRVSHILVPERADAERIAEEVTPQTFAEIAQRESTDPGSARRGGRLGSFTESDFQTQFDPDFVAAALDLEDGEISGAVQTQFGWHVIQVHKDVTPFEDVRDQLVAEQSGSVFAAWVLEQLDATDIEVNPRFGRLDPATGRVVPVRSTQAEPTGPTAGALAP
ncbi:MAG TPA: peptidylprolyl isomerase [Actinomycetota bacterium]